MNMTTENKTTKTTESAIAVEPVLATGLTCRKCKHNQAWQCNSKVFHYCGIRKSKQTSNGHLKIKCKNIACDMFKSIN